MSMIMKIWRWKKMNDDKIVKNLISFIETKERELQINKMTNDSQAKNDIVKSILDELESEVANENKED